MSMMKIRVDWIPPTSLGVNSHRHWRGKHPDEQAAKEAGMWAAKAARITPDDIPDLPVLVVIFHWDKRSRKKDSDNALGTAKHLIDGICEAIGINDRRFVTSMAFQRLDPKKQGFTEVLIRPATKEERQLAA